MTSYSITIVRHLQTLECQIAEAAHHHNALRAATVAGDRAAAQYVGRQAELHLRAMAITTAQLKAHVVPADGLGPALESLSELALRSARLVVLNELHALRALVHEVDRAAAPGPVAWGRFYGIEDLTVCVHAALGQATASWSTLRGNAHGNRGKYRAALHAAHAAMRQLGTASEFGRFLWEGRHRTNWPSLQATCVRMSVALTHRIDVEPDRPLLAYESAETCRGTFVVIHERAARLADGDGRAPEADRHSQLADEDLASYPSRTRDDSRPTSHCLAIGSVFRSADNGAM